MYASWIPFPDDNIEDIKKTRNIILLRNSNPALDGTTYYYDKADKKIYEFNSVKSRYNIAPMDIAVRLRRENAAICT